MARRSELIRALVRALGRRSPEGTVPTVADRAAMRSVVTRSVVSAVATAAVSASLAGQIPWQNGEFRPSPADKPALQILVGDFTRRSTGDVLLHEATVRNQATTVFDLFAQNADGRMLRVLSPTTGQWTGPVPGPLFLTGTPVAVPATQDPAAIVQIDKLSLDADGRFDDLVALTSMGKLLVLPNRGQSAYGAGFPDLDSNGAYTLYDFADPANGFGIATLKPIYSCLATGDFDGNGTTDLVWRQASTNAHVMWLTTDGQVSSEAPVTAPAHSRLVATGADYDANGDGRTDLVWKNLTSNVHSVRLMNGASTTGGFQVAKGTGWDLVATGRYDGNQIGDLLWRNEATGSVVQWLMTYDEAAGTGQFRKETEISRAGAPRTPVPTMSFAGNSIAWRRPADGTYALWKMLGSTAASKTPAIGGSATIRPVRRLPHPV